MQNETANAALTKTFLFNGRNIMKMDYKALRLCAKPKDELCKYLDFRIASLMDTTLLTY